MTPSFSFRKTSSVIDSPNGSSGDEEYLDATMQTVEDDENPLVFNAHNNHEIEEVEELDELIKIEEAAVAKSDRTTLADLFKTDPTETKNHIHKSVSIMREEEEEEDREGKHKKLPICFSAKLVKKLIPIHDADPIGKISHMMRRMMKRKIHPELLRPKSDTDDQVKTSDNEALALLQSDPVSIN